jgi:hypothetical protein
MKVVCIKNSDKLTYGKTYVTIDYIYSNPLVIQIINDSGERQWCHLGTKESSIMSLDKWRENQLDNLEI